MKKPKGFAKFDKLMKKLVKLPPGAVVDEPKRFCPKCSHDRWEHGNEGCRHSGCDCQLKYEET